MTRGRRILLACAAAILLAAAAPAQEKGQLGLDLAAQPFEPSASVAARFHLSPRLALRPVVTAVVRRTEGEDFSSEDFEPQTVRTMDVQLGLAMGVRWYFAKKDAVSPYVGADAGYVRLWREFVRSGPRQRGIAHRGFNQVTGAVVLGGHYAPSRRLGVFAEVGVGWLSGRNGVLPGRRRSLLPPMGHRQFGRGRHLLPELRRLLDGA